MESINKMGLQRPVYRPVTVVHFVVTVPIPPRELRMSPKSSTTASESKYPSELNDSLGENGRTCDGERTMVERTALGLLPNIVGDEKVDLEVSKVQAYARPRGTHFR